MRGACEFYLDFLVREPENNWLVVAPSYSPENSPVVMGKRTFVVVPEPRWTIRWFTIYSTIRLPLPV